jgi:hypothetical protein
MMAPRVKAVWDLSNGICRWTFDDGRVEDIPVHKGSAPGEYYVALPERIVVSPECMQVKFIETEA